MLVMSCQAFVDPAVLPTLGSNWHLGRVVGAGHERKGVQQKGHQEKENDGTAGQ